MTNETPFNFNWDTATYTMLSSDVARDGETGKLKIKEKRMGDDEFDETKSIIKYAVLEYINHRKQLGNGDDKRWAERTQEACDKFFVAVHSVLVENATLKCAIAAQDKWQPIETAPLDGTRSFLVFLPISSNVDEYDNIIQVSGFEGNMYPDYIQNCISFDDRILGATHWMPLPKPPMENQNENT